MTDQTIMQRIHALSDKRLALYCRRSVAPLEEMEQVFRERIRGIERELEELWTARRLQKDGATLDRYASCLPGGRHPRGERT